MGGRRGGAFYYVVWQMTPRTHDFEQRLLEAVNGPNENIWRNAISCFVATVVVTSAQSNNLELYENISLKSLFYFTYFFYIHKELYTQNCISNIALAY